MTRRGFFAAIAGLVVAPKVAPMVFANGSTLTCADLAAALTPERIAGTYAGIDRATFPFWRAQYPPRPMNPRELEEAMEAMLPRCHPVNDLTFLG